MVLGDRPYTFDRVFRLAASAALTYGAVLILAHLSEVLIPFAVAFLAAYLLNPLVLQIERRVKNRVTAVAGALALVLLALVLLLLAVAPLVMGELSHMGSLARRILLDADLSERAMQSLPPGVWEAIKANAAQENLHELLRQSDFLSLVQTVLKKVLPGLWGFLAGTASLFLGIIGLSVIVVYTVFILLDFQRLQSQWRSLLPPAMRDPASDFLLEFNAAMGRYFRAQAVVAGLTGVFYAVGFVLIGLPLGILLGLFLGVLNMVPYLQVIGAIPAALLAVVMALEAQTSVLWALVLVGIVFAVVQALQETLLVPRFMGKATGLSPAMIMLSISIWGKLLGFLGLIIALPATCLALAYYRRLFKDH